MSFLLCCLASSGNVIDNNIKKNNNDKIQQKNNIQQQMEGIQTTVLNEQILSKNTSNDIKKITPNNNYNTIIPRRNSKNQDTVIDIGEFEKCQYWFYELLKHCVNDYEGYGKNKKELNNHIFNSIDLTKTLKHYNKYNKKYNNYDQENIKIFSTDSSNLDFIQDIRIYENIYRFH